MGTLKRKICTIIYQADRVKHEEDLQKRFEGHDIQLQQDVDPPEGPD